MIKALLYSCIFSAILLYNCNIPVSHAAPVKAVKPEDKQINFIEDKWNEALKEATKAHKYIFVDAYASWCGPCKMLKTTTFKNRKAAAFYNEHFINISIDMEKGDGPKLSQEWNIQAYPTLIILNEQGKALLGTVGYIGADELIKFGEAGLKK